MPKQPKIFLLTEEVLHALGNYLAGHPYREVAGLIAALNQLQPAVLPQQDQSDNKV